MTRPLSAPHAPHDTRLGDGCHERRRTAPPRPHQARDARFEAPFDCALPDLRDLVGRTRRLPEQEFKTAYFDTPEGRLAERGMVLRHRLTDDEQPGTWTLHVPAPTPEEAPVRREHRWSGPRAQLPPDVGAVLRGVVRRSPVQQTLELVTLRQRLTLLDDHDELMAEMHDDRVVVVSGARDGLRFRLVEIEHRSENGPIDAVTDRLLAAGLRSESSSVLDKALGAPARHAPRLSSASTMVDVVRASLDAGSALLLDHDWRLRLAGGAPRRDDVHHARVATRRLRSDLKTFGLLLDPVWLGHVRRDLEWVGSALGAVRDVDVLADQLEGAPLALCRRVSAQRRSALRELEEILASDRYLDLLDRLHAATQRPPVLDTGGVSAEEPARDVLPVLLDARWRAVRRQARKARRDPSDRRLHQMRIKTKQLRYAAEAAAPVLGPRVAKTAKAAARLQGVLGDHHDAVRAQAWLRAQVATRPDRDIMGLSGPQAFEAGRLGAAQHAVQESRREAWPARWRRLRRARPSP